MQTFYAILSVVLVIGVPCGLVALFAALDGHGGYSKD